MKIYLKIGLLLVLIQAVSGCGLKGDLYMPDNEQTIIPHGTK